MKTIQAYGGSGKITPLILNFWHCVEVSGKLHAPAVLPRRTAAGSP